MTSIFTKKILKKTSIAGSAILILLVFGCRPPLEDEIQAVCLCYDQSISLPSKELQCASLKYKLEARIKHDSLEKIKFDSLIIYCVNYPSCQNLEDELARNEYEIQQAEDNIPPAKVDLLF